METKIILTTTILILLLACTPIQEKSEPTYIEEGLEQEKQEEEYIPIKELYKIKPGETLVFEGIPITLTEIQTRTATIKVGDTEKTFTETNVPKIIEGLEISVFEIFFDPSNLGANKVVFKINKLKTGEDQYLMYLYDEISVNGITLRLSEVKIDRSVFVEVPLKYVKEQVKEGQNKLYGGLNITNIKGYFGDTNSEKSALLEVK